MSQPQPRIGSLPTAYCLLPTAYCLLPTAYWDAYARRVDPRGRDAAPAARAGGRGRARGGPQTGGHRAAAGWHRPVGDRRDAAQGGDEPLRGDGAAPVDPAADALPGLHPAADPARLHLRLRRLDLLAGGPLARPPIVRLPDAGA